jgi:TctA family transporter
MMTAMKNLRIVALPLLVLLLAATDLAGQLPGSQMATQSLRAYWHVFIAYAIAIVMVLGWVVSIARRLARIEAQLGE